MYIYWVKVEVKIVYGTKSRRGDKIYGGKNEVKVGLCLTHAMYL